MNAITINIPGLSELLDATKTMSKELGEIKALLKIDKHDEREFVVNCKSKFQSGGGMTEVSLARKSSFILHD